MKYKYIWGNPNNPEGVRQAIRVFTGLVMGIDEPMDNINLADTSTMFLLKNGRVEYIFSKDVQKIICSSHLCEEFKPEQAKPKYGVGDWVRWNGGYYKVTSIEPRYAKNWDVKGVYQLLLGNTQWVGENLVSPAMGFWVDDKRLMRFG